MSRLIRLPLLAACCAVAALAGCALPPFASGPGGAPLAERLAQEVNIIRDAYGVPHIHARTDAGVVFGIAWAQAEDNFWQVEEDHIRALGRASHYYGETMLAHDLVRAAFEVERLSREEYERQPAEMRRLLDAYAAGLNHYLQMNPHVTPRLIGRFEPWYPLAIFRSGTATTVVDGVRLGEVVELAGAADWRGASGAGGSRGAVGPSGAAAPGVEVGLATARTATAGGEWEDASQHGSNAWAIAPARSETGRALLFQNPHVGFFGGGQRWEVRLESEEGWQFAGFAVLGTPFPRSGHNARLGWTHTNTAADASDAFLIEFSHPTDPLSYRHGDGWLRAEAWIDTIRVNTATGVEARAYGFRRTHHGPVVAQREGRAVSVRVARYEDGGNLQQWYAMGRAGTLEEFRAALAMTTFPISNTMYADAAGNIMYVHGNAVPRRDPGFDWTAPVDGADPAVDWQGYHTLDELPQYLNPAPGWLQNTNATPFLATAEGHNLDPADYPSYMAREADNARARVSRRILERTARWTLDALEQAAFDTEVVEAEPFIAALVDEWERLGAWEPERALRLDRAIDALRQWDRRLTTESVPATHFLLSFERLGALDRDAAGGYPHVVALEQTLGALAADWQTTQVAWGELNRLQRVHTSGTEPFSDDAPSLPVAGAPGRAGVVFAFSARGGPTLRRRYGTSGHTWVGIVEFGEAPRARSIVQFGQSADPASPHWFDQAPLYAAQQMKPVHFGAAAFHAAAVRVYQPGAALTEGR